MKSKRRYRLEADTLFDELDLFANFGIIKELGPRLLVFRLLFHDAKLLQTLSFISAEVAVCIVILIADSKLLAIADPFGEKKDYLLEC